MNIVFYFLLSSFIICSEYSDRYYKSMDKGIEMFDSSKTEVDFLKVSNYFYRISQVIKTDWLSSYYYAYANTSLSMMQEDNDLKEEYLDKALNILAPFDTLKTASLDSIAMSEIYTLRAMIYVGKIFINPMINGMKYGPLSEQNIEKAKKLNVTNPRPYYLSGQSKFYTPSAFGGGVDKALPILKDALDYYDNFKPKKYWPNWGYDDCKYLYNQALEKIENQN
tara:strand:- start:2920 stop:3588 length:669 start_codon:yes stop_codon:yes gene_type:complete